MYSNLIVNNKKRTKRLMEKSYSAMDIMKTMSKITDNIYLSDWNVSVNKKLLIENKIKTVICINKTEKPSYIMDLYDELKIKHHHFDLDDTPYDDISKYFDETYKIMNDTITVNKQNVLVHCTAGVSRSATIVLYYILRKYTNRLKKGANYKKINKQKLAIDIYNKVFEFTCSKRRIIGPNSGFIKLLKSHTLALLTS